MFAYIALTVVMGAVVTLHMSMNAYSGILSGNARMANVIFWATGLVTALVAASGQRDPDFYRRVEGVVLAAGGAALSMYGGRFFRAS